jgi:hypothetical protein
MLVVSDSTDDETRSNVNEFIEQHDWTQITPDHTPDNTKDLVEKNLASGNNNLIVVQKYEQINDDFQKFLAQYLKGVAEKHTGVPIIVFDAEGSNLGMSNPDLHGRVYSL